MLTKEKEQTKEKKKSKVVGWSTAKMEENESKQELKDTKEMVQWKSIDQEGMNNMSEKHSSKNDYRYKSFVFELIKL